ncbi:MAG: hypothetical protein HY770_03655 [Chitinivibrionia bacterium]|nr:hypothetical protein [Chitinivibrionia bacterium]
METGGDSLIMESGAAAPGSGEPAARGAGGPVKSGAEAGANQALIDHLLAMAHQYRSEGNLRQATELYWTLAEDYLGTPQADAARAALLELAAGYERNEARHMARSIYKRLLE